LHLVLRISRTSAALVLALLAVAACSQAEPLKGTQFNPPRAASKFRLTDQNGMSVSLSGQRGQVVLLTFLYTSCPDICPVVAGQVKQAYELLGRDAEQVSVLIVSVDPERDTPEAMTAFLDKLGMLARWHYLLGTEAELAPVWRDYYVAQARDEPLATSVEPSAEGAVDSLAREIAAYTVTHSSPVYVIDGEGVMRSVFTLPIEPTNLVHDVRVVLEE
jgi:protein SCO1/2